MSVHRPEGLALDHPIVEVMTAQGRRWDWLARETGYSPSSVSKFVHGERVALRRFRLLCTMALGLPEDDLFHPEPAAVEAVEAVA